MHEEPEVPNYGRRGCGPLLKSGMCICIEPMINMGRYEVYIDADDNWTVLTDDGLPSAQWEHTFVMTDHGLEILTH